MTKPLPEDPFIRSLVLMAQKSQFTRRGVLSAAGAGAIAVGLAACAPTSGGKPKAASDTSDSDKTLNWVNWPEYIDVAKDGSYPTLVAFEKETGIKVKYTEGVDDNNSYYAKVKDQLALGQDIGADTVCLTDWMVARLIGQGYVQKLNLANIPNSKNLNPSLENPDFDKGRHYSLPWQSGFAGLCWNKEKVPGGLKQVSDLWKPELKGRVGVLSEMRDTIGLILMEQGVDISKDNWGDKEFEKAIEEFKKQVQSGQIRNIKGNSYIDDLSNGDTVAAIVWSGDVTQLEHADKYEFAIPETGGTLWSDNFLVPIGSPRKTNAEKLINYYYEPEVAAAVADYVNYITPVDGAKEAIAKIDPSQVDNQLIFPNEETLSKVKIFRTLTNAEQARYSAEFEAVGLGS